VNFEIDLLRANAEEVIALDGALSKNPIDGATPGRNATEDLRQVRVPRPAPMATHVKSGSFRTQVAADGPSSSSVGH
jgi:hypothetical protein